MNELSFSNVETYMVNMLLFPSAHVEKEEVSRFQIIQGDPLPFEGLIP